MRQDPLAGGEDMDGVHGELPWRRPPAPHVPAFVEHEAEALQEFAAQTPRPQPRGDGGAGERQRSLFSWAEFMAREPDERPKRR